MQNRPEYDFDLYPLLTNYIKQNAEEKYPASSSDIDKIRSSSEELNERIREIIRTVNAK